MHLDGGAGRAGRGRGRGRRAAADDPPPSSAGSAARSVARPDLTSALTSVSAAPVQRVVTRLAPKRGGRGRRARWETRAAGVQPRRDYLELMQELEMMLEQGWADATIRAAGTARRAWDACAAEFRDERPHMLWGPDPRWGISMQASLYNEISLMIFAVWLVEELGLKPSTASTYLSLTRSSLEMELGWKLTCTDNQVRLPRLLRALRRMRSTIRKKRLGWRAGHMRRLAAQLGPPGDYESALERAVLNVAREALARCAELGPERAGSFDGDLQPTVGDLAWSDAPEPHVILMILPAKKAPGAPKCPVPLSASVDAEISGYHSIVELLRRRRELGLPMDAGQPLFMHADGSAATRGYMVDVFRRAGAALGLPAGEITGHCGRIGGATDHFAMRTPPEVLQICGRWDSDIWQVYTRQCIGQSLEFGLAASRCEDVSIEELLPDYTQPASVARLHCAPPISIGHN